MELSVIERYLNFVEELRQKYDHIGSIVVRDTINPQDLNRALANYYSVSSGLIAEYRRKKLEHEAKKIEYSEWYDQKFEIAKKEVIAEYKDSRSVKPSVKEFETRLRITNRTEYSAWQKELSLLYAEVRHYNRLADLINSYGRILETISKNMRSELFALSVQTRANTEEDETPMRRTARTD